MNLGTEDKKKLTILSVAGVGALGAVFYMYTQLFPSDTPTAAPVNSTETAPKSTGTPAKSGSGSSGKPVALTAAALDPTLHMGPMLTTEALLYQGSGRNIFSGEAAPAAIPKAIASPRPQPVQATYTPPAGPPPPPPIDLKFFGTAAHGVQQPRAFLLHGEDVFLASVGDVVQRRYKIIAISANSCTVQDLTNNNQQSLPLILN